VNIASAKFNEIANDTHIIRNTIFERLCLLVEHFNEQPLYQILNKLYNYPRENSELKLFLEQEESKTEQMKHLLDLVNNSIVDSNGSEVKAIQQIFSQLSTESYIANFLQHLLQIQSTVGSPDANYLFSILQVAPSDMISDLIFNSGNYSSAEKVASDNNIHLVRLILDLCLQDTTDSTSRLSLNVTQYLGSKSPLIAILAALLLKDQNNLQGELLDYAVELSNDHPFLRQWVSLRLKLFDDLIVYHSKQSAAAAATASLENHLQNTSFSEHDIDHNSPMDEALTSDSEDLDDPHTDDHRSVTPSPPLIEASVSPNAGILHEQETNKAISTSYKDALLPSDTSSDITKLIPLVHILDGNNDDQFYISIAQSLIDNGDYTTALRFANTNLLNRIPDYMLQIFVERTSEKHMTSAFIPRIQNDKLATQLTFKYLEQWDIDTSIDLIEMCISRFEAHMVQHTNMELLTLKKKAQDKYSQLLLFKKILSSPTGEDTFVLWTELNELAHRDPHKLISDLIDHREYELARSATQLLLVNAPRNFASDMSEDHESVMIHIEQQYSLYMLENYYEESGSEVLQVLIQLPPQMCVIVCRYVVEKLQDYRKKLFLVEFLISCLKDHLLPSQLEIYNSTLNGMKVLCELSKDMQEKFEHLLLQPELMIESLLMQEQITIVSNIYKNVPELRDDQLIIRYGKKALDIHEKSEDEQPEQHHHHHNHHHKLYIFADDDESNQILRSKHRYPQAPSVLLAKSIFDICSEPRKAGEALIQMCDAMSLVQPRPSHQHWIQKRE
jgi:hypothetical protein